MNHYNDEGEIWDLEIKPRNSLWDLNLRELWHYKDLIILFVRRDFVAQYKQTVLGPLWHLIQPVLTTAMFLLLFTRIASIPTDGIPPVLFYLSGITIWNYFSTCLVNTSNTFVAHGGDGARIGNHYFITHYQVPRLYGLDRFCCTADDVCNARSVSLIIFTK